MATTEEDKAAKAADGKATVLLDQLRANNRLLSEAKKEITLLLDQLRVHSRLLVEAIHEVHRRSKRVDRKMAAFVDAVDRLLKTKSPEVVEGVRAAWEKEEEPEPAGEAKK
jgi:enoyl-CoA hydratase/carnithine racemase